MPVFSSHLRRRRSDDGGGFSFGSAQTQARCLTHFRSPGKGPRFPCNYYFSTFSNIFVMPSSPCHHLSGHTILSIFPPRSSVRGFVKATKLRCDKISRQNLSPTGLPFASGGIVTNRSRELLCWLRRFPQKIPDLAKKLWHFSGLQKILLEHRACGCGMAQGQDFEQPYPSAHFLGGV